MVKHCAAFRANAGAATCRKLNNNARAMLSDTFLKSRKSIRIGTGRAVIFARVYVNKRCSGLERRMRRFNLLADRNGYRRIVFLSRY